MHQKYAKTLKEKVEIYANFPTEKFLSKVTRWLNLLIRGLFYLGYNESRVYFGLNCKWIKTVFYQVII